MTVKLNKKKESKPSLAPRPLVRRFRSMDAAQIRLVFAGVFAFSIVIAFFVFSVVCEVKNNELDHYIKESMNILSGLENDYDGLVVKKETLMSDSAIQTYAEDNLGMQKRDNHQLYWFEVDWENDFDD